MSLLGKIFGSTTSTDVVCDIIDAGVKVINTNNSKCKASIMDTEAISLYGCSNVHITDVDFKEYSTMDLSCIANNSTKNRIKEDVQTQMAQKASTVKDTFFPQLDTTSSSTYSTLVQNLSTEVTNAFKESCTMDIAADQSITCHDSHGVFIDHVKFADYAKGTIKCVSDNVMDTSAATELCNFLTQQSDSLSTDPVADLVNGIVNSPLMILGILAVLALFIFIIIPHFGVGKIIMTAVRTPAFWIAVIILVIFFVIFFYIIGF